MLWPGAPPVRPWSAPCAQLDSGAGSWLGVVNCVERTVPVKTSLSDIWTSYRVLYSSPVMTCSEVSEANRIPPVFTGSVVVHDVDDACFQRM